jgi:hypothetical protein
MLSKFQLRILRQQEEKLQAKAATEIQCLSRRITALKVARVRRACLCFAIKLQCAWRIKQAVQIVLKQQILVKRIQSAVCVQSVFRRVLAVIVIERKRLQRSAAVTMQNCTRRLLAKRAAMDRYDRIIEVQAWMRGCTLRRCIEMQHTGAVCVEILGAMDLRSTSFLSTMVGNVAVQFLFYVLVS